MKKIIIPLLVVIPLVISAQEKSDLYRDVTTNVDFLMDLLNRQVRGEVEYVAANQLRNLGADTVRLAGQLPQGTNRAKEDNGKPVHVPNWMLEQIALNALQTARVTVISRAKPPLAKPAAAQAPEVKDTVKTAPKPAKAKKGKNFILEYRLADCYMLYDKVYRHGLIGRRMIRRYGKVSGFLQLKDPVSGAIIWHRKFSGVNSDIVPFASKAYIENSFYNFRKPAEVKPYWKEFVEITLAGGTVGYLLYLFFSQSFN